MLTWDTTLRLVRNPSPLLMGLVLDELDEEINKLKGRPLTEEAEVVLRGFILKRFMLRRRIVGMIDEQGETQT